MARIRSILGDIEGSAGQLTFSKQNGKNILRQKVGSNSSNTLAQQDTRGRFKLLAELYRKLATALQLGLKPQNGQSAYNRFVGQNFGATSFDQGTKMAMVDHEMLVLSGGAVEPLENFAATLAGNTVTAAWDDNSNGSTATPGDTVTVVVINKQTGYTVVEEEGARRSDGTLAVTNARLNGVAAADLMAYGFARRFDGSDASATVAEQVA